MADYFKFAKKVVSQPINELEKQIESIKQNGGAQFVEGNSSDFIYVRELRECPVSIKDQNFMILRVFINSSKSSTLSNVGWVMNSSLNSCLLCATDFSCTRRRHHCRACGALACGNCCGKKSFIIDKEKLGRVRVCKDCFSPQSGKASLRPNVDWGTCLSTVISPMAISSPKNNTSSKPIAEAELTQTQRPSMPMEENLSNPVSAPEQILVQPTPGFVIKTKRAYTPSQPTKIFVDVMHSSAVSDPGLSLLLPTPVISPVRPSVSSKSVDQPALLVPLVYVCGKEKTVTDKTGGVSGLFTVVVSSEYFEPLSTRDHPLHYKAKITDTDAIEKIIQIVNKTFEDSLGQGGFVLPRVATSCKGPVPTTTSKFYLNENPVSKKSTSGQSDQDAEKLLQLHEEWIRESLTSKPSSRSNSVVASPVGPEEDSKTAPPTLEVPIPAVSPLRSASNDSTGKKLQAARSAPPGTMDAAMQKQLQQDDEEIEEQEKKFGQAREEPLQTPQKVISPRARYQSMPDMSKEAREAQVHLKKASHDDDNRSEVSDISVSSTVDSKDRKFVRNGRRSVFVPLINSGAANIGRQQLEPEMLEFIPERSINDARVKALKKSSGVEPSVLLGWQIALVSGFEETGSDTDSVSIASSASRGSLGAVDPNSLFVITDSCKNHLRKTEYRISNFNQDDAWVRLKRSKAKAGIEFRPLRKVLDISSKKH